jgi:hypothetical protein
MSTTYGKASWPIPSLTDAPNATTMVQAIATQLDSFVIPKYASSAAQAAANPAPADGDKWYRTDLSQGFQFRNVNGGVTVPDGDSWSYINEAVITTTTTQVIFTSIPQTFRHLRLYVAAKDNSVTAANWDFLTCNWDVVSNYGYNFMELSSVGATGTVTVSYQNAVANCICGVVWGSHTTDPGVGVSTVDFPYYSGTTLAHGLTFQGMTSDTGSTQVYVAGGSVLSEAASTAAITTLTVAPGTGSFVAGSIVSLYGIGA